MNEDKKKEKVLHARISEDLEKQIKEEAGSLGVSVSNLVRNILTNTFELVEHIVSDSAGIARSARRRSAPPSFSARGDRSADTENLFAPERILGWQEAVLNLNAICRHCNEILKKGNRAAIAVVEGAGPRPCICLTCLKEIAHENRNNAIDDE